MNAYRLELFFSFVDLVIIFTAVLLLSYSIYRGFFKPAKPMPNGGVVLIAGLLFAVVAHLSEPIYQYLQPVSSLAMRTGLSGDHSPPIFQWVMSRLAFALIVAGFIVIVLGRKRIEDDLLSSRALSDDLRSSHTRWDKRFRFLINGTSNSVYCYDLATPLSVHASIEEHIRKSYDMVLSQCNNSYARELGTEQPDEVLGQRYGALDCAKDFKSHTAFISTFVKNGYRLVDYELSYRTRDGDDRTVNVNMIGVVENGYLERIWGVDNDLREMRETRAELAHQQSFQELVATVSTRLVTAPDDVADKLVEMSIADIAEFVGLDRSTIFWVENIETEEISVASYWSRDNLDVVQPSQALGLFPGFRQRLLAKKSIVIDDVAALPPQYEFDKGSLQKLGLKSLLVLPLIVADELVGGMTFGRLRAASPWSRHQVQQLTVFSEILANFVLRLKSRRALDHALSSLQRATDRLEAENVYLREEVELKHGFDDIVGESHAVMRSLHLVEQVADTRTTVLILGETGTGKELIARALHELSERRDRPLVKVNCAALPVNLMESELFGHVKGAFTGADSNKRGRFDLAHGSTLFLDEIGEIPIEVQSKLLRVLQEGEFERVGGTRTIKVDVRIVVATNRDLKLAVQDGEFRSDLFYRINMFPIEMPALRDRGNDVELLARHFIKLHAQRLGRDVQEIGSDMMRQLREYQWPGNVRELDGIIQRALISSTGPVLELAEPLVATNDDNSQPKIISSSIADLRLVERDHIVSVLEESRWKISGDAGAASQLGIPPSTLRSKMKKLGIRRPT